MVFQPIPFLWAKPCHTGVSLYCDGKTTVPKVIHKSLYSGSLD
ncbi:TPA: hypothetical protein ACU9TY_003933 [Clostridioides difficile]|nr:hypothetical protein [Clostridioides difficile]MDI3006501.1 hypothetical protein [Clostridioides difficile]MDN4814695.1 hypothetical protein [Clostridioides difficile]MDU4122150.1 hypothetical protein [Clostridioides difficile]MDV9431643.1 hypothetical protein [Clostridioides difficile]MDY6532949.1 hypothetical protein [Clostridioides difficile]